MASLLWIALCSLLIEAQGVSVADRGTPTFRWSEPTLSRFSNEVPSLHVKFTADGPEDIIELERYTPVILSSNKDSCTFLGTLKGDGNNAVVAVTGCPQSPEYEVTILRSGGQDITVSVNDQGISSHIESPNAAGLDYVLSPTGDDFMTKRRVGVAGNRAMPMDNNMTLVAGYTKSTTDYFGSVEGFLEWLTNFMTHMQAYYLHDSLGFKVYFQTPVPVVDMSESTNITAATADSIESLKSLVPAILDKHGGHHLLTFVQDNSGDSIVGIAYLAAVCYRRSLQVSVNEVYAQASASAKIGAHELGHNFGVGHDDGNCKGIMYFSTGGGDDWSSCSRKAFEDYYDYVMEEVGVWCLVKNEGEQGTWSPWSEYSQCSKPCGSGRKRRTRTCDGKWCRGASTQEKSCNTQDCPTTGCVDIRDDCPSRRYTGLCGSDPEYMKENCRKTCAKDTRSESMCKYYKGRGYCDEGHRRFKHTQGICGKTCGYFCPE